MTSEQAFGFPVILLIRNQAFRKPPLPRDSSLEKKPMFAREINILALFCVKYSTTRCIDVTLPGWLKQVHYSRQWIFYTCFNDKYHYGWNTFLNTFVQASMNYCVSSKVLDEIAFPNFNRSTAEFWEWANIIFSQFMFDKIYYPCRTLCSSMLVVGPIIMQQLLGPPWLQ